MPNLLPGTYDLKATGSGSRPYSRTNIVITANTIARADLQLELGATTEQITVQAEAAQIQTDKADTHTTITAQAIAQMPLPGYRNYQSLMNLVPRNTYPVPKLDDGHAGSQLADERERHKRE